MGSKVDSNSLVYVFFGAFVQTSFSGYIAIAKFISDFSPESIFLIVANMFDLVSGVFFLMLAAITPQTLSSLLFANEIHFITIYEMFDVLTYNLFCLISPTFFALDCYMPIADVQSSRIIYLQYETYLNSLYNDSNTPILFWVKNLSVHYGFFILCELIRYSCMFSFEIANFIMGYFYSFFLTLNELLFAVDYSTGENSSGYKIIALVRSLTEYFMFKFLLFIAFVVIIRSGTPRYRFDYLTKLGGLKFLGFTLGVFIVVIILYYLG